MACVAYLCTDLLFTSKIREAARAAGWSVAAARDLAALRGAALGAEMVIIDLRRPDGLEALAAVREAAANDTVVTVGFCDHERVDRFAAATAAGCDRVLTKGQLAPELSRLLAAGAAHA